MRQQLELFVLQGSVLCCGVQSAWTALMNIRRDLQRCQGQDICDRYTSQNVAAASALADLHVGYVSDYVLSSPWRWVGGGWVGGGRRTRSRRKHMSLHCTLPHTARLLQKL